MKKLSKSVFTAMLVLTFFSYAFAELKVKTVSTQNKKPVVKKEHYVTTVATVEAIDLKARIVTLKNEAGTVSDVKVGPEVKNLPQVKKGDQVTVKYYEAVSAKVYKAGDAPKITDASATVETAKAGEKPGGKFATQSTVTSTIQAIDLKKPEVTLKTLEGKVLTIKVEDPKLLENVKVGDEVVITYSEALAISVEPMKKKSTKK